MAPKRQRGESSHSTPSYDKHRFISPDVATFYEEVINAKKLIPERGLQPNTMDGHLRRMIIDKQWGIFASQPAPAVVPIVKEFYANAKDVKNNEVRVRGKTVSFSAAAINAYYELPNPTEVDDYTTYATGPIDYEELIQGLCQPDATWKIRDGEPKHFSYTNLSRYGKAWYYFMCAKMMPTTHVTEVIKDRAVLLYCIVKDKSINMGHVINNSIKYALQKGPARGLPHPSLICALCQDAGVTWADNELTQNPQVIIDTRIIRNFKQWNGAPPDLKGAGFLLGPQSPSSDDMAAVPPTSDAATSSAAIIALGAQLQTMQRRMEREHRRNHQREYKMDLQLHRLAQRQSEMNRYNFNFDNALVTCLARMNPSIEDVQLPERAVLSTYPPPTPDDEEDVSEDTEDEDEFDAAVDHDD